MQSTDWVEQLRVGHGEAALDILRSRIEQPATFLGLGTAYMWLGDFQSSFDHFDHGIQTPRMGPSDIDYGMAGTAAWCLGRKKEAIEYWEKGTKVGRGIAGANTRTALLLYVASVLEPATYHSDNAERLLATKLGTRWITGWPDPLAEFIIGEIDEDEVRKKGTYKNKDFGNEKTPHSWQLEFYKLLKTAQLQKLEISLAKSALAPLVAVHGAEYVEGKKFFYFLRTEEYYLLRHHCSGGGEGEPY